MPRGYNWSVKRLSSSRSNSSFSQLSRLKLLYNLLLRLYMNIRPATLWRTCFPRSLSAATLSIGEPSSSKTIIRIEASRLADRTSYSTSTSDNGPPKKKFKLPENIDLSRDLSMEKKKPFNPPKRQNGKADRRRLMNAKKKKVPFHNKPQNTPLKSSDIEEHSFHRIAEQVERMTTKMETRSLGKPSAQLHLPL